MKAAADLHARDAELVEALRKLGFALRSRRMYPTDSPVLQRAMLTASTALRSAVEGREVVLEVLPHELRWQGMSGDHVFEPQEELASRLHRHRISRIRIGESFTTDSLGALLASTLLDPDAMHDTHPLLADQIDGFSGQSLELASLYEEGGEAVDASSLWDQVLDGFVTASHHDAMQWADLGREPVALAELLGWTLDPTQQSGQLSQYSQTDLFGLILEQVAAASQEGAGATVQTITEAVQRIHANVDPEVWLEVLAEPLHVAIRDGAEKVNVDLASVISQALSAGELEDLVGYAVRSRRRATPRLYRFFQAAIGTRPDATSIARNVIRENPQRRAAEFGDAWPGFIEALTGEDVTPYVKADYSAAMDSALGSDAASGLWDDDSIGKRMSELGPDYVRLSMVRVSHALLSRERDDNDYRLLLKGVLRGLDAVLRQKDVELLESIASTLAQNVHDLDRSHTQRQAAQEGLHHLRQPQFMQTMVALLAKGEGGHFHALWRVVDLLGTGCLPYVLDAMAQNPTPAYRHHLARILQQTPELPVELLAERMGDDRLHYVRDLVMVISETGRDEAFGLLEMALAHSDAGVRRVALNGLCRFPAERVEHLLIEALSDAALEVRVAALRGFRDLYADRSQEQLIKYLRLGNLTGANTKLITAAAKALAGLGDQNAIPDLQRLSRRPLLFRQRRMAVALAARESIVAIEKRIDATLRDEPASEQETASETVAA